MNLFRPPAWAGPDPAGYPSTLKRLLTSAHTPVWYNQIGGITYHLADGGYLKVGPLHPEWDPRREAARAAWAGQWVSTAETISVGVEDGIGWLLSRALKGWNAITCDAREAVPALGRALRAFHDALPVESCPWTWSVEERLGVLPSDSRAQLAPTPAIDRLVVCHGDACNPNFLLAGQDRLECTGYVDLDHLGVADRWADLAPACLSLGWNFGPGWDDTFLDAYGVKRDDRLEWYQRLWNAA